MLSLLHPSTLTLFHILAMDAKTSSIHEHNNLNNSNITTVACVVSCLLQSLTWDMKIDCQKSNRDRGDETAYTILTHISLFLFNAVLSSVKMFNAYMM